MADYFSPTVVQPNIPLADMTPLEQLLLRRIFSCDDQGDNIYFFAEQGANDLPVYPIGDVRTALVASEDIPSATADIVRAELAKLVPDAGYFEIETTDAKTSWEAIFQDVVRRSSALSYVVVVSSWTCTKMLSDGFGGMAIVITADEVMVRSTDSMIDEMIGIAEYGSVGVEPGIGSHVLLRLCEEHVRATVETIFETEAPDGLAIADVTDADIRQASLDVKAAIDLSHEEAQAAFNTALAAIRIAAERQQAAR
jgi:hypothetical protein